MKHLCRQAITVIMPNPYIALYEARKQQGVSYVSALRETLVKLQHDLTEVEHLNRAPTRHNLRWVAGFFTRRRHHQANVSEQNLAAVTQITKKLKQLVLEPQVETIVPLLIKTIQQLSPDCQAFELIKHLIEGLISTTLTTPTTHLVAPPTLNSIIHEIPPENPQWSQAIEALLRRKNLDYMPFERQAYVKIHLHHNLAAHASWAFQNIYSQPYPHDLEKNLRISRSLHGIQHVSRVALYVPVLANLYRKHGDTEAAALTHEDLKLLQIAALFHDSAREDEAEDQWDHESALILYHYLTRVLGVAHGKAKKIAEATANKDLNQDKGYFEIIDRESDHVLWRFNPSPKPDLLKKNIYQKIIHDADCLDIIRARRQFDAHYLDFYKEIACKEEHPVALEEMAQLITEVRSLIEVQGDSYCRTKLAIKQRYEYEQAFNRIKADIELNPTTYKIMQTLSTKLQSLKELVSTSLVDLTPYNKEVGLTEENTRRAMRAGLLFARGIATPSAIAQSTPHKVPETLAELELRKTCRALHVPTRSQKSNNRQKQGNPLRSISMLCYGSEVFSNAGFLIVDPNITAISQVSTHNNNTGRGKKNRMSALKHKANRPDISTIKKDLVTLYSTLKIGAETSSPKQYCPNLVEILYDTTRYDAIFYSDDPNLSNYLAYGSTKTPHPLSPFLQAIFLRNQYAIQYQKTREDFIQAFGPVHGLKQFTERFGKNSNLPLFYYSGLHNQIILVSEEQLSDRNIIKLWIEMCSDYMNQELNDNLSGKDIMHMNLDDIKIYSLYKTRDNPHAECNGPADANYPEYLRVKLNVALEEARKKTLAEHERQLIEKIKNDELSVFSDQVFFKLWRYPSIMGTIKDKAQHEMETKLASVSEGKLKASPHLRGQFPWDKTQVTTHDLFLNKSTTHFFSSENLKLSIPADFIYTFSTDPKRMLNRSHDEQQIYFETTAVRFYVLSKQLSLEEIRQTIQIQARQRAEQTIMELSAQLRIKELILKDSFNQINTIAQLDKFITTFDLSSHFKTQLDEIKNIYFIQKTSLHLSQTDIHDSETRLTKRFKTANDFKHYAHQIDAFYKLGWLNPEYKQTALEIFDEVRDNIKLIEDCSKAYMTLAASIGTEKEALLALMNWFKTKPIAGATSYLIDFIYNINQFIPLTSDDNDYFQIIVNVISRTTSTPLTWIDTIEEMSNRLDLKTLTIKQLDTIQNQWVTVCNDYVTNRQACPRPRFKDLIDELDGLQNTPPPFPIPKNVIHQFNAELKNYADGLDLSESNNLTEDAMIILNKLHEKLPFKEEREVLIVTITLAVEPTAASSSFEF